MQDSIKILNLLCISVVDRSTQPDCPTYTPASPATPLIITTRTPEVADLAALNFEKIFVCRGEQKTISIPKNYYLFPTDVYYGVSSGLQCVIKYLIG